MTENLPMPCAPGAKTDGWSDLKKHGRGRPEGTKKKAAKYLPIAGKTPAAKQKALDRILKVAATDPAAKQAARDAGFADDQKKLLQIADEPTPKAQLAKVKALEKGSGKTSPKPNNTESEDAEPPLEVAKREFQQAKDLRRALKRLSEAECQAFLCVVLRFVLGREEDDQREEQEHGGAEEENGDGVDHEQGDDAHDEDGDDEGDDEGEDDED